MATIDEIIETRRVIANEIAKMQVIIISYVESKLDELDETIADILADLAEED